MVEADLRVDSGRRNRVAVGYMLVAVLGYSLVPLFISLGSGDSYPFLFNAVWKLGFVSGIASFLVVRYWRVILNQATLSVIFGSITTWAMMFTIIAYFDLPLYAWSVQYIDISLAVIINHIWPISFILVTSLLFRADNRYLRITSSLLILLALGFVGFVFVIMSQTGTFSNFSGTSFSRLSFGIILIIAAAGATSLSAFALRWAADLQRKLPNESSSRETDESLELFGVVIALLIAATISTPITVSIGLVNNETITVESAIIGVIGGVIAGSLPSISLRKANLITNNLGVNAFSYATPIVALVWLFIASQVGVAHVGFFIIGTTAIIVANLLINFEAEIRTGFKTLILGLWVCGTIVYLRPLDGLLFGMAEWLWQDTEEYFAALAVSATIFTLILSFRVARLVSRTSDEENRTFVVSQKLDMLARRGVISNDVHEQVLRIDVLEQRPRELEGAYTRIMDDVSDARNLTDSDSDRGMLSDVESELNVLVHSKQQGLVLGELFALYIFAGITVLLALFSRPPVSGWIGFLVEMFALLFSAVIIFLLANVFDIQRERIAQILKKARNGYRVAFRDTQTRLFEQWISLILGLALIITFAGLLWYKWLGGG